MTTARSTIQWKLLRFLLPISPHIKHLWSMSYIITHVGGVHGFNIASVRSLRASMRRYDCCRGNIDEDRLHCICLFLSSPAKINKFSRWWNHDIMLTRPVKAPHTAQPGVLVCPPLSLNVVFHWVNLTSNLFANFISFRWKEYVKSVTELWLRDPSLTRN